MPESTTLTVGQVARLYDVAAWKIRRIVDALFPNVPRAGQYRLIARSSLPAIAVELQRRNWLPDPEPAQAAHD